MKGSHIVVPRLFAGKHAFMLQNPDGRIVFAIPYEQKWTLVGTTDVPFSGDPAHVRITDDEIRYLCDTINRYFQRSIAPSDVRWTYAGVRPLFDDASKSASHVTRDYRIELTQSPEHPPLLSIFGGKLTTYRRLAETVLEKLQDSLGSQPALLDAPRAAPGRRSARAKFPALRHRRSPALALPAHHGRAAPRARLRDTRRADHRQRQVVRRSRRALRRRPHRRGSRLSRRATNGR